MPQPRDTTASDAPDLRRADDGALLSALDARHPLALAEAYHRTVPAAHAVARRLVGGAGEVEDLMLEVYDQLWSAPPTEGPLEGWVRRTTWARGADRLRDRGAAPASPSAAGMLPDLPAPDVRFLDAAERAIAELADDERRALLLAHDKGVPSDTQEPGAGEALTRALRALAGPETSTTDRTAMTEDGCDDVGELGDWCLGLLDPTAGATVAAAIEGRAGCATASRAVRRGRRRIEGLPATPDMGQRILVTVLTSGGAPPMPPPDAGTAGVGMSGGGPLDEVPGERSADQVDLNEAPDGETIVPIAAVAPLTPVAEPDPFAPPAGDVAAVAVPSDDPRAGGVPADDGPRDTDALATAPHDVEGLLGAPPPEPDPVVATADLPQATDSRTPGGSWIPGPGDTTAELRLSDILADEGEDDDPFADLGDDPADGSDMGHQDAGRSDAGRSDTGRADTGGRGPRDPYSALRGLGEDEPLTPQGPVTAAFAGPDPTMPQPAQGPEEDEDYVDGYVEGQEDDFADVGGGGRLAGLLAWVLPILGGAIVGIIGGIFVFGLP